MNFSPLTLRQTGRTKRMLLAAAIAVSEGKDVILLAHDERYAAMLRDDLRSILVRLSIPFRDSQLDAAGALNPRINGITKHPFIDHVVFERGLLSE